MDMLTAALLFYFVFLYLRIGLTKASNDELSLFARRFDRAINLYGIDKCIWLATAIIMTLIVASVMLFDVYELNARPFLVFATNACVLLASGYGCSAPGLASDF